MSKQSTVNNGTGRAVRSPSLLETILPKVPDDVKVCICKLYNENKIFRERNDSLKADQRKNAEKIAVLQAQNDLLLLEKATVNSDRSVLSVINKELRRQLGKYYNLSIVGSVCILFADAFADWSSVDFSSWKHLILPAIGTAVRIIAGVVILCCAYMAKPSSNEETQAEIISSKGSKKVS